MAVDLLSDFTSIYRIKNLDLQLTNQTSSRCDLWHQICHVSNQYVCTVVQSKGKQPSNSSPWCCSVRKSLYTAKMLYWYKQTLGQRPRRISSFYKHDKSGTFTDEFKNNQRFSLETNNGKNHLTISGLHISDSATYYC
uniref:Ig-like domain-containing protein n=1 Tax=Seriola lalandi dorsalis TaxID=1841481 RepID=A0A3B4X215_SERLL